MDQPGIEPGCTLLPHAAFRGDETVLTLAVILAAALVVLKQN